MFGFLFLLSVSDGVSRAGIDMVIRIWTWIGEWAGHGQGGCGGHFGWMKITSLQAGVQ